MDCDVLQETIDKRNADISRLQQQRVGMSSQIDELLSEIDGKN